MLLVKCDTSLSEYVPDSAHVKVHRGTYLVGEITEQSIKVFTQATSARLVVFQIT